MSTHNICFCREIRKILCGYPPFICSYETVMALIRLHFWSVYLGLTVVGITGDIFALLLNFELVDINIM